LAEGSSFPEMSSVFGSEPGYEIESSDDSKVVLKYENGGITEIKTIEMLEDFKIRVAKKIINNTEGTLTWKPELRLSSQSENKELFSAYNRKFSIVAQRPGMEFDELEDNKDIDEYFSGGNTVDWIGINYGYFMFAVLSEDSVFSSKAEIDADSNKSTISAFLKEEVISPGNSFEKGFTVYYGTKERELLKKEDKGLEKTISFGWTSFLSEPLLLALNFFYEYIGNYGLAIILLTIVVKLLLFPLSNASYKSMSRMRALQPKIKELQEKYKKDKETLNKETMLLYQKEGVNPLGGCLPMFIQMPVYIALYYMIQNAVELYNAPFLPFWLTDLSEKDPFYIIPVSLGLLMFLQTKLSPQTMDNAQAKIMMYTMPVVFTWISLVLPSGMTLYWFVNTLLGIAQQLYVNKKYS
jgi:YidC/Oxa1 family membrane protein insertase